MHTESERANGARKAAVFTATLFILFSVFFSSRPHFLHSTWRTPDNREFPASMPFYHFPVDTGLHEISLVMELTPLHPVLYEIAPDDCLEKLEINGRVVRGLRYPLCTFPWSSHIALGEYLRPGQNHILATVRNRYGGAMRLIIRPSALDPLSLGTFALLGFFLYWYLQESSVVRSGLRAAGRRVRGACAVVRNPANRGRLRFGSVLLFAFLLAVWLPLSSFRPEHGSFRYQLEGEPERVLPPPLSVSDGSAPTKEHYTVETAWRVPRMHHTLYSVEVDDCVDELWVNNRKVENGQIPLCNYPYGGTVDLSGYLRPGNNTLKFRIFNFEAGTYLTIRPSLRDRLFLPYYLAAAGLLLAFAWPQRRKLRCSWKRAEHMVLALFLFSRVWVFLRHLHIMSGWDWFPHLEILRLNIVTWGNIMPLNVGEHFYAYHPPLGFLLARTLISLGMGSMTAVMAVSFLASLIGFFFLRATVKSLGMLASPAGILFLYVAAALPLQVFMAHTLSLDVIVFAFGCAVLYASVALFSNTKEPLPPNKRYAFAAIIVLSIFLGLMTKFSALVTVAIPVLAACAFQGRNLLHRKPEALRALGMASLLTALGLAMAFPYYHLRYYQTTGTYFPHNGAFFQEEYSRGQRSRDEMGLKYLWELLRPSELSRVNPHWRDIETNRLPDAWKDMWIRDVYLGSPNPLSMRVSIWYLRIMPWALLLGAIAFAAKVLGRKERREWAAFGLVLIVFSLLQVAALLSYMWKHACSVCYSSKAIYIAPATLGIAFLLVELLDARPLASGRREKVLRCWEWFLICALAVMVAAHHVIPVY